MPLNRFEARILKRSKGHNSIGKAAYNSRSTLRDERTGRTYDFSGPAGQVNEEVLFQGIFAPKNAPDWARDRERLWNEVEASEDRQTHRESAQLARDLYVSIPHELSQKQMEWLVKDFAKYLARKGMVVDFSVHKPDIEKNKDADERNYHAHILLTMREIGPDGFGNKVRQWNETRELMEWKEKWSEMGARALERAGLEVQAERFKWGHLANRHNPKNWRTHNGNNQRDKALERGDLAFAEECDREPTKPLGKEAIALERKGVKTVNGKRNDKVNERNRQRRVKNYRKKTREKRSALKEVEELVHKAVDAVGELLGGGKPAPKKRDREEERDRDRERDPF